MNLQNRTSAEILSAYVPARPGSSQLQLALRDLWRGLLQWPRWFTLGNREIVRRYSRSALGPFWIVLSTCITVGTLGAVYSRILHMPLSLYLPYLTAGIVIWSFISISLQESSVIFIENAPHIEQTPAPFSTYIYRIIWQNILVGAHNALILVPILAWYDVSPFPAVLLAVPALALLCVNVSWMALLIAMVCTRFRDVPRIVTHFLQLLLLVTPVFWRVDNGSALRQFALWNPFYYMVELVRAPLLGKVSPASLWLFALATALVGWSLTLAIFARHRRRIAYWA
jgi:ABC-type polysaccharide/polyol phosphate export permease